MEKLNQELRDISISNENDQFSVEELRKFQIKHVFDQTANAEFRKNLWKEVNILKIILVIVQSSYIPFSNRKYAALALVNISGDEAGAEAILDLSNILIPAQQYIFNMNIVEVCLKFILNKVSHIADECCMILSNITRVHNLVERVVSFIEQSGWTWNTISYALISKNYNTHNAELHYLASVLNNLTQSSRVRRYLMDPERCIIQRLFRYTQSHNEIRQRGIVGILKNCTFETKYHEWLLSPNINLLPHLLLPLAGPEEFDQEDIDKLPSELQYLSATKQRDPNPEIRLMLLQTLFLLCATRVGRQNLREKNTYIILREFHKWEQNKNCLETCEDVINILIKTEEEIGVDNLKELEVPAEYTEKFQKIDQDFKAI